MAEPATQRITRACPPRALGDRHSQMQTDLKQHCQKNKGAGSAAAAAADDDDDEEEEEEGCRTNAATKSDSNTVTF